ncbi:MAG TPA: iron-sulfur cluster assembly accessory protein [Azospirillum sp.]|nr:iron-sulfur cluster assembly accessory protein [Azospirillum sp.]
MVTLTQTAVATLEQVLAKSQPMARGLRIAVTNGGCAGLKYQMGLEAEASDDDAVLEFGCVRVFIDPDSQPLLDGVVVDFVEGVEDSGFKFDTPKASSCGCGKSFSVGSCPTSGPSGCGSSTQH